MKPIIFALVAIFFYGTGSVIIEQKLVKLHVINILIIEFAITLLLALAVRQYLQTGSTTGGNLALPTDKATWISLLILGVIVFAANYLFNLSLILGGNAIVITSLMILMPVATVLVRNFWVREMPNIYCIAGYILAALSVLLVAKGTIK